jgi:hypothetical protein
MLLLALIVAVVVTLFVFGVRNLKAGRIVPGVLMVVFATVAVAFMAANVN